MRWWRERTLGEQVYLVVGLILVSFVIAVISAGVPSAAWDFRNNLWAPTHLLVSGLSPYRIDQLFQGSNAVWLPTAIGAFLPLGALPLNQASMLWSFVGLGAVFICVIAATRVQRPQPVWLAVALLTVFLFPSTVSHFHFGQFTFIALLLAMSIADMLERGWKLWAVALALVLSATKPQVVMLFGVGVLVWMLRERGFVGVAWLAAWGAVWTALMIAPLFLLFPDWIDGMLWAFGRNPTNWFHPSTLMQLRHALGDAGVLIWAGLLGIAVLATIVLWLRLQPSLAVIWTMGITPLVMPYVWSYDFVLMLPLLVFTLFHVQAIAARLLWVIGCGVIWTVFLSSRAQGLIYDEVYWWVPWAVFGVISGCWLLDGLIQRGRARRPQPAPA